MTDYEDTRKLNVDANVEKQNDGDDVENADQEYEVGHRKPPKHTQFKRGQSGNPKGRPKESRNFSTDLKDTLKEPVRVTRDGQAKDSVDATRNSIAAPRESTERRRPRSR